MGQRFGKLIVTSAPFIQKGRSRVYVYCDCGCKKIVILKNLKNGNTRSCGCSRKGINRIHGQSHTRLHRIWRAMRTRCNNPNCTGYCRYGGRGITVCEDWDNFVTFQEWANKVGYRDDLTIDRIDNDQGYYPENCRWIPLAEQPLNRSLFNNNTSGYRGVYAHQGKWQASIGINKKLLYLGLFDTKEEAALAWNAAAIKHRGKNTRLNKVRGLTTNDY